MFIGSSKFETNYSVWIVHFFNSVKNRTKPLKPDVNWFGQQIFKFSPTTYLPKLTILILINFKKKKRNIICYIYYLYGKMKRIRILYYYEKINWCKLDVFKNIFAYLFLIYPINSTQTNLLLFELIQFGFYQKNMKI